ncbi:transcriptional regulator [Achromatium sp. WMS2]|nr:transcriptional regulator [Achromatium sp. WMS2]
MKLLIVEDESTLRTQLALHLKKEGYITEEAKDGEEGFYLGKEFPIDLAIVDLGLPKLSGIELIQKLRELGRNFPILILTARSNWQDKVEGLEAGADDYLVKPFNMAELSARVHALLRRAAGHGQSILQFGPITIDTRCQEVRVSMQTVELTAYEYRLIEYLALNAGKVISKTELTEHLYAQDYERDSNVLEVFIGRLRRKLDPENCLHPIETLRGRGYRLVPPKPNTQGIP